MRLKYGQSESGKIIPIMEIGEAANAALPCPMPGRVLLNGGYNVADRSIPRPDSVHRSVNDAALLRDQLRTVFYGPITAQRQDVVNGAVWTERPHDEIIG